ncbi:N-acetyltransferase [Kribbella pittospori]|uniref:N-acetyltransferase n=1 Tax=Kribbella pittospori TaxID=722689 RepID=A0A4R0JGD5_9ACTN|nr:N-acetyltransferase [Kribbella pittospori]
MTTVVALDHGAVMGFAELFSDGELQAYLANMVVDETRRGEGIGRAMVNEALRLAGSEEISSVRTMPPTSTGHSLTSRRTASASTRSIKTAQKQADREPRNRSGDWVWSGDQGAAHPATPGS